MPSTRQHVLLLVLAALALAGCLGSGDAPASPASSPAADDEAAAASSNGTAADDRIDWTLSGCRAVVALVPTDAGSLEEHLPEGFAAASAQEAFGIPPDPRGEAALGVETFQCESGTTLDGTAQPLAYGALFAAVEPPEGRNATGADLVLYKWETLVPDEDRRRLLQEAGMPAVDGSTDLSGLRSHPAGHAFHATLTLNGSTHAFAGTVDAPADAFREGLPFVEFQAGDDGIGRWVSEENQAPDAFQGTGTLDPVSGSRVADVVGDGPSQAYMVAATSVTFSRGYVDLPGAPS